MISARQEIYFENSLQFEIDYRFFAVPAVMVVKKKKAPERQKLQDISCFGSLSTFQEIEQLHTANK
mgnify:CR=1 FL=1